MTDKTPRSMETRTKTERRRPWAPPSSLDAPPAPEGYVHRWIRLSTLGNEDKKNVAGRLREGFELVRAEEYPDFIAPTIQDGVHAGVMGVGGLALARFPLESKAERDAYYNRRTRDQMEAVDKDLMQTQNPSMPIAKDRRTRVTFGGPRE